MSLRAWWKATTRKFRRTTSTPDLGKEPYQGSTVRDTDDLYLSVVETGKLYGIYQTFFSQAFVGPCAVAMYFHPPDVEDAWVYQLSGVPVVVWLPMEGRVVFYIADMESGDPLWNNEIVNHNQLKMKTHRFYTMKIAGVKGKERVGLTYDCGEGAYSMFAVTTCMVDKAIALRGRRWFGFRPRANPGDPLRGPGLHHATSIARPDMYQSLCNLNFEAPSTHSLDSLLV